MRSSENGWLRPLTERPWPKRHIEQQASPLMLMLPIPLQVPAKRAPE
jgi:hypothetical protein